ncbi:MAG TPA: hypothetical protein VGJ87_01235 [Roseiflexaceae bacterium]|jgi:hypothetical protein
MPVKKDLTALLSEDTTKPALRRGRGLRLSTEAAQNDAPRKAPRARSTARPKAAPRAETNATAVAPVKAPEDVAPAPTAKPAPKPTRDAYELRLRRDLVKACKRIAKEQNRKLNRVIEEALDAYLRRRG